MRTGRLFLLGLAAVALPGVVGFAVMARQAVAEWRQAEAAIGSAPLVAAELRLPAMLNVERGLLLALSPVLGAAGDMSQRAADLSGTVEQFVGGVRAAWGRSSRHADGRRRAKKC